MAVEAINVNEPKEPVKSENTVKVEPKTEQYPNDTVELSTKNKKKSIPMWKKFAIGAGGTIAAAVGVGILVIKHHGNRIKKLYDEKLILSNLKEKIDFKEAATVQEGIKFAKEVLGIKEVDANFTLEAINAANRGLVDVSNAHKGKVFMPHALRYTSPRVKNDYVAAVQMDINSSEFGHMYINKHYFDKDFLDAEIKNRLYNSNGQLFEFDSKSEVVTQPVWDKYVLANPSKDVAKLIRKYYRDSANMSVEEKRNLFYSLAYGKDDARRYFRTPAETYVNLLTKHRTVLNELGYVPKSAEEIEKLTNKQQKELLTTLLDKLKTKNIYLEHNFEFFTPLKTIYHEMGHLQDAARNLKDLDLRQWKFDLKGEWRAIKNKRETGEITSRADVDEVDNRWGSVWDEYMKNFLLNNPEKFKKKYPDLYEFVTNKKIMQTSGKVSAYAQSGIGEFIAETYARLTDGKTLPDDVMALYRKYKGPEFLNAA